MPTKYLTSALRALWNVYRVPGQTSAPPSIELDLPIQVVHDVAQDAPYSRSIVGGVVDAVLTGGAGVDVFSSLSRTDVLTANVGLLAAVRAAGDPASFDVWVTDVSFSVTDTLELADLARATCGFTEIIDTAAGVVLAPTQVADFTIAGASLLTAAGRVSLKSSGNPGGLGPFFPLLLTPARTLVTRTADDGTGVLTGVYRWGIRIMPAGTRYP